MKRFYRPQLDVVRFTAFLAVFVHHVLPRTGAHGTLFRASADALGFGLCLFFMLSAYLITLLLLREQEQTGSIDLPAFYKRRILRIWPLYLVGLGIGVIRAVLHGVFFQQTGWFVAALLLSGNMLYPGGILVAHLWSISVEEQFYLLFPSACRNLSRRSLLLFVFFLFALSNAALIHFAHTRADLDWKVWSNSLVQSEMFGTGVLLAIWDRRLPPLSRSASIAAIAASLGLLLSADGFFHLKTIGATAGSAWGLCLGYAVVALACSLLITAIQSLPAPDPLVYSGRISYGLYVFHVPAFAFITSRVPVGHGGTLLSLAVTYGLAALSYRYFETPFLRWKRNFEIIPSRPIKAVQSFIHQDAIGAHLPQSR